MITHLENPLPYTITIEEMYENDRLRTILRHAISCRCDCCKGEERLELTQAVKDFASVLYHRLDKLSNATHPGRGIK